MNAPLSVVLAAYRARLESIYGSRLRQLILFGSRARGDAREDSDIDLMIVLDGPIDHGAETRRTGPATTDVDLAYGVDISRSFANPAEMASDRHLFYRTVQQEGRPV
ncbi:MAG: nucleotidyltransferase domain-containing protein [Alphaproteobacteria bacterium]|nr:nucleotidyltransferase domain-containing protein [Alphaproteobacteria bacterium]